MKTAERKIYSSAIGLICVCYQNDIVFNIEFIKADEEIEEKKESIFADKVFFQIEEYLSGKRKSFDFPYELKGSEFQKNVWNALLEIPYGETKTYKEIAILIGNPKACRAVGMANNKNPLPIVVPCHRVIGSNGKLVGYAGGVEIKDKLLEIEKENNNQP